MSSPISSLIKYSSLHPAPLLPSPTYPPFSSPPPPPSSSSAILLLPPPSSSLLFPLLPFPFPSCTSSQFSMPSFSTSFYCLLFIFVSSFIAQIFFSTSSFISSFLLLPFYLSPPYFFVFPLLILFKFFLLYLLYLFKQFCAKIMQTTVADYRDILAVSKRYFSWDDISAIHRGTCCNSRDISLI